MIEIVKNNQYSIIGLFPVPLMVFNIRDLTEGEKETVESFCIDGNNHSSSGNKKSNNTFVLEEFSLLSLKNEFLNCVSIFDKKIHNHNNEVNYSITQSWINTYDRNDFQSMHIHPNSVLSGVYYYKTNDDIIGFSNQSISCKLFPAFSIDPKNFNMFNGSEFFLPVHSNSLIIFPSDLLHYVPQKESTSRRISLSFNTKISGIVGDVESLTYCKLN